MQDYRTYLASVMESLDPFKVYTPVEIDAAAQRLGLVFPAELRLVLELLGPNNITGIEGLADPRGIVYWTERYRELFKLPPHFIVVSEMGDCGIILVDSGSGATFWIGNHDYEPLIRDQKLSSDAYVHAGYADLVQQVIESHAE